MAKPNQKNDQTAAFDGYVDMDPPYPTGRGDFGILRQDGVTGRMDLTALDDLAKDKAKKANAALKGLITYVKSITGGKVDHESQWLRFRFRYLRLPASILTGQGVGGGFPEEVTALLNDIPDACYFLYESTRVEDQAYIGICVREV